MPTISRSRKVEDHIPVSHGFATGTPRGGRAAAHGTHRHLRPRTAYDWEGNLAPEPQGLLLLLRPRGLIRREERETHDLCPPRRSPPPPPPGQQREERAEDKRRQGKP
ncbi:hypothetical protein BHE74_00021421 [Ensete ventricosum]|nr:hypothetical protein BHE74_00021421 [Ensete ventricosum]